MPAAAAAGGGSGGAGGLRGQPDWAVVSTWIHWLQARIINQAVWAPSSKGPPSSGSF